MEELFKKWNKLILANLQKNIKESGSDRNISEFEVKFDKDGNAQVITTLSAYFESTGRKPGKMPPHKPIAEWAKKKRIDLKYVYPIRKKIGEDGVKGKHFLEISDEVYSQMSEDLGNYLVNKIKEE